jgi:methionyl aminopeptidase
MDPEVREKYIQAGRVAAMALVHGLHIMEQGVKVREILDSVEQFIQDKGAGIAFPAQISINETAAHFCPDEEDDRVLKLHDVVKLDVGAHIDGYVGDNAATFVLSEKAELLKLKEASQAARDAAIKMVKAGVTPRQIGAVIEREITSRNFTPIRNLSGHGVAQYTIHTKPSIPNIENEDETPLPAGTVIAIEPFASTGSGIVRNGDGNTLYSMIADKPVRSPFAREALEMIKSFNGLPFTTRWLSRELGVGKTKLALKQLVQAGILHEYPPLVDSGGGLVSQSEHTIIVEEDGCTILTVPE